MLPFTPVCLKRLSNYEQDISKLRRDVKIAFEDMTAQMNRCNNNWLFFVRNRM
jgi:hypothetical protein